MTHEQCIAPLKARTHFIFYPDSGWGPAAGRYMWMDEKGKLLYFRYHGTQNEITDYKIYEACNDENIRGGFYALEDEHLRAFKGFQNIAVIEALERAYYQFQSLLEALKTPKTVFQIKEKGWVGYHPILGHVHLEIYSSGGADVEQLHWGHEKQIMTAFYRDAKAGTIAAPAAWDEVALPYFQHIENSFEQVHSGDFGLFRHHHDGSGYCYSVFEKYWFGMPLLNGRLDRTRLMNPFACLTDLKEICKWLERDYFMNNHSYFAMEAISDELKTDLPVMVAALQKSKSQVLDDYIAAFKNGLSISMGPTTDQTWTIYYENNSFWTRGYRPKYDPNGNEEGYEQVIEPYTEEKVREVLSTYKMFGLWRLE